MLKEWFVNVFGGILGMMAAFAVVGIICALVTFFGYTIVKKYNKPGTKLFKEITPMQYVGIIIMMIGMAPFLQYFFQAFLFSAGREAWSSVSDQF